MTHPPLSGRYNGTQPPNYFKLNNLMSNYFLVRTHMSNFVLNSEKAVGGRRTAKSRVSLSHPSVETVLDQWRAARPELDLGPLGLFAALAHAYWLCAPEIERLMGAYHLTR